MDFTGKVAVVTGGAKGIGRALTQELVRRGADVYSIDRDISIPTQAIRIEGVTYRHGNVESERRMSDAAMGIPPVDILVHNAGIMQDTRGGLLDSDLSEYDWLMPVNEKGPLVVMHAFKDHLQAGSKVVFISSALAESPATRSPAIYLLSKMGMASMAEILRDTSEFDVKTAFVGPVATELFYQGRTATERERLQAIADSPEVAAQGLVQLIGSDRSYLRYDEDKREYFLDDKPFRPLGR
jgi:3-oxoacyl-[acyl-carrier protein] reductase